MGCRLCGAVAATAAGVDVPELVAFVFPVADDDDDVVVAALSSLPLPFDWVAVAADGGGAFLQFME